MAPTGRSKSNSREHRHRRMWAGCSRASPSVTSRRARRKAGGEWSDSGPRCKIAWSANCACARFAPSRPRKPTCRSSSPTSIGASVNRPPTRLAPELPLVQDGDGTNPAAGAADDLDWEADVREAPPDEFLRDDQVLSVENLAVATYLVGRVRWIGIR